MVEEIKIEKMEVRGKAIASIPKFVSKNFGKKGYQQWLDAISAEAHNIYILPIKENDWYPLKETIIQPCANIAQLFYQWDLKEAAWTSGRFSADFSLSSVYKLFVKMGSASFFLNKATEYMNDYYRPAAVEVGEITSDTAIIRITRFPEIDKTIEYRIAGWIQRALEINGCKNVMIEIPNSLMDFKPCTEYKVSWE